MEMEMDGDKVNCKGEVKANMDTAGENCEEQVKVNVETVGEKLCVICGAPSKYCCPACSLRTCSLKCVNAHKLEKQCSGVRDKTAFVDVKDFNNVNMLSDYRFLEEATRAVNNAERTRRKQGLSYHRLPVGLHRLRMAARHRKTVLQILPMVFSRRKLNTTYLRYEDNVIFWRIEWSFPQIGESFYDERIHENTSINYCLDKYLLPDQSSFEIQEKLFYFQALGHKGVCVLLKKVDSPANDTRYFELNKNKSLRENFMSKVITEYPTLYIIGREHVHIFNLVENDILFRQG